MGCKHRILKRNNDKNFNWICRIKDKDVNEYICRDCPLKIEDKSQDINDLFGQLFGKGFGGI